MDPVQKTQTTSPYGDGQISHGAVALFQASFAIITPALISGAVVERMNFRAWILFYCSGAR